MTHKQTLCFGQVHRFSGRPVRRRLACRRLLSLANAILGVISTASLAVNTIGQGLLLARGRMTKHAVKQVDRLLSNPGTDVDAALCHWVPHVVGPRTAVNVAMEALSGLRGPRSGGALPRRRTPRSAKPKRRSPLRASTACSRSRWKRPRSTPSLAPTTSRCCASPTLPTRWHSGRGFRKKRGERGARGARSAQRDRASLENTAMNGRPNPALPS